MSTSPEARMMQLTMTDDDFTVLNAMFCAAASKDKVAAVMATVLIGSMPDATDSLFTKVNELAKSVLPEKRAKLAAMERGGYAE